MELNNVKATSDGVLANLALIQRDDGVLANGSVSFDQLSPALQTAGLAPALPWVTGTAYSVNASVTSGSAFYRCLVAHTSGTFATDLAAGKWILIVDFATIALVAASLIAVTPSGSLTSNVQTSLQALDTGKAPTSHTHVSTAISDSTTAGRALLTAANAAAQNALLGTTSLGFQSGDIKATSVLVLPTGWYWCDGSNKSRVTDAPNPAMASVTTSGARFSPIGDAQTPGQTGGALSHVLTAVELPVITPTFTGSQGAVTVISNTGNILVGTLAGGVSSGGGGLEGIASGSQNTPGSSGTFTPAGTVSSFGGGLPHSTQPKSIVMNYVIKR